MSKILSDRELIQQALDLLKSFARGKWTNALARDADSAIAALRQRVAELEQRVPDGWKLVPVEPTTEMLYLAGKQGEVIADMAAGYRKDMWDAMLAAAPQPTSAQPVAQPERPAPCARHCEANAFQIEIRRLKSELAQPAVLDLSRLRPFVHGLGKAILAELEEAAHGIKGGPGNG